MARCPRLGTIVPAIGEGTEQSLAGAVQHHVSSARNDEVALKEPRRVRPVRSRDPWLLTNALLVVLGMRIESLDMVKTRVSRMLRAFFI
jgi:hypothetical protein